MLTHSLLSARTDTNAEKLQEELYAEKKRSEHLERELASVKVCRECSIVGAQTRSPVCGRD